MNWYLKVLQNYATFSGRARRKEYWMFILFNFIISIVFTFIDMQVGTYDMRSGYGLISTIYSLVVLVPSIAVAVRRMHDVGKSGWFILIPIYNFILAVTDGDKGANEYGPDPKDPNSKMSNDDLLDDTL